MASETLSYGLNSKIFLGEHAPRPPYNALCYWMRAQQTVLASRAAWLHQLHSVYAPPFFNVWIRPCHILQPAHRRRVLKLTFLYQLMHGHFIFPNAPLERCSIPCSLRHVHPSTLLMPSFRTNAHQFSFSLEFATHQYSFSRYCVLTKSWDSSYEDMLTFCNLPTLCQRRRLLKLTFLCQSMHGHFIFPNAPLERRSIPCNLRHVHPSTLLMPSFRTNAHQFSFFPHAISIWNSLPASVHSLDTVSSFKHAISLLKL